MWKNIKKIIADNKGIFAIGIGDIAGNCISASFWFILAIFVGPEEYGQIHYFLAIAGLAQIFSLIATSNTLVVYTAKKIQIQSSLVFISFILGIISAIAVIITTNRFDIALLVFAFMSIEISSGILLGSKKYSTYSKYLLIQKILLFTFGLSFFHIFGIDWIFLGIALSYVAYTKILFYELRKIKIDFSLIPDRKGFIFNNYVLILSGSITNQIDKFIIAPILGFGILGEYSLALQILVILTLVSSISFKYFLSQDSTNEKNNDIKKIVIFISIGIAIFGSLILPSIIPVFFSEYTNTIDAIRILSWIVVPETLQLIFSSKLLGSEKSKFVLMSNIISTIFLIIGFLTLGPLYGIVGLSIILLISTIIQVFILIYGVKRANTDMKPKI